MIIKVMDVVYCPERKMIGQIHKIRNKKATIKFITGDTIYVEIHKIIWRENVWTIQS